MSANATQQHAQQLVDALRTAAAALTTAADAFTTTADAVADTPVVAPTPTPAVIKNASPSVPERVLTKDVELFRRIMADTERAAKIVSLTVNSASGFGNADVLLIAKLPNVKTVSLIGMPDVTDVSALRSIDNVVLHEMHGVADVSALRGVCTLHLGDMPKVSDVSALRGVHTFSLCNLPLVTDVSMLRCTYVVFKQMPVASVAVVQSLLKFCDTVCVNGVTYARREPTSGDINVTDVSSSSVTV